MTDPLVEHLTSELRTPRGTMVLRPLQARALAAMQERGRGVFVAASVGVGKTLMSALAMTVLGGERPMMFTSASIIAQTEADFAALRLHWRLPTIYRLEPYEKLGMAAYATMLDDFAPTCLILDEAHKLKHVTVSARAKRMARHIEANPHVPVVVLSGSPGADAEEFAHLLWWVLGADAASVLFPGEPGSKTLRDFCSELREDDIAKAEFGRMLAETPGCIISPETYRDTPLEIREVVLPPPDSLEEHFANLRDVAEAPDGWALDGPAESWTLARCLANGFYYEHVPRPPESYREAWKAWSSFFRDVIDDPDADGGPYDTPGQVAAAVVDGPLPAGKALLETWLSEKEAYKPDTRTVWFDSFVLDYAIDWGRKHAPTDTTKGGGCIIWAEQTGIGEELSRRTGWPYYGSGATDARGRHVKNARSPVIIASRKACGTGFNLQHRYSQNLFLSPPSCNEAVEQTVGRTHRSEQHREIVTVEMLITCIEDYGAIEKARKEARAVELELSTEQKLSLANSVRARIPDASTHSAWRAAAKLDAVVVTE